MGSTTSETKRLPRPEKGNIVHLLAFGMGAGCSPKAPGTMGTLLAVAVYLLLSRLPLPVYLAILTAVVLVGIWLCDQTARDLGVHDHPGIVWDEFVGYWITMWAMPVDWLWIVAGFVVFRVFDIVKPWPVSVLDKKVKGGLGIMVDDVLAGVMACATLHLARWLVAS